MKKDHLGQLVFSPSDLVRYLGSPFASWMDRYSLENPDAVIPDEETEDERLIAQTGEQHEKTAFEGFKPVLKVMPIQAGMNFSLFEHIS